ncbi:MAG: CPBP family intramembrane metalloprotease [Eubacterium sp.]|nr:CPBP family intramembrane metalloprotease [Eubacterium sp.]
MSQKHSFNEIWDIFKPFILYYLLYNVVFILFIYFIQTVAQNLGADSQTYLAEHTETVTGIVNGLSTVISVLPLMPMLKRELADHKRSHSVMPRHLILTAVLAVSSSLGLNVLLALTNLVESSAGYQDVAQRQYSVVFGAGMVLFGLISPITEEIVFRGLIFNRMRRYFPHAAAVVASGILFGIYHGNLVQGLYGGCMGILMAYLYERMHSFVIPCFFHAMANIVVYMAAQNTALHGMIFTAPVCVVLLGISVVCIVVIEKPGQS